jgi:hypothetical protein
MQFIFLIEFFIPSLPRRRRKEAIQAINIILNRHESTQVRVLRFKYNFHLTLNSVLACSSYPGQPVPIRTVHLLFRYATLFHMSLQASEHKLLAIVDRLQQINAAFLSRDLVRKTA